MIRAMVAGAVGRTFATWSPADKGGGITLSNGNKTMVCSLPESVRATIGLIAGKWYWEVYYSAGDYLFAGVSNGSQSMGANLGSPNSSGIQTNDYRFSPAGGGVGAEAIYPGEWIGFGLDITAGTLIIRRSSTTYLTISSLPTGGALYPSAGGYSGNESCILNAGATAFNQTVPAGYNPGVYQ